MTNVQTAKLTPAEDLLGASGITSTDKLLIVDSSDVIKTAPGSTFTDAVASAEAAAANVAVGPPYGFKTVAALVADTVLSYTAGENLVEVTAGDVFLAGGFRFEVAASGATTNQLATAGGVKLNVLSFGGKYCYSAFDAPASGDATTELTSFLEAVVADEIPGFIDTPAQINTAITISVDGDNPGEHITLQGNGQRGETIKVNNATGGIHFQGTGVARSHSVELKDMQFDPLLASSGYPFKITGTAGGLQNQSCVKLTNVSVGPLDESVSLDFDDGPSITGLYRPEFNSLRIFQTSSGTANKWTTALDISGCYKQILNDIWINVANGGATTGISNTGTTEEGGTFSMVTVNGADTGYYHERTGREPEFWWNLGHIAHKGVGMRINGVKFGSITKPLVYASDVPGGTDAIDFLIEDADGLTIDSPQLRNPGVTGGDLRHFWLEPKSGKSGAIVNRIHIKLSTASMFGNTPVAPIYCNGATNVVIEIPDGTDTTDTVSYIDQLVEFGPSQDPDEVTIVTTSGLLKIDNSADSGPDFVIDRESGSPADDDDLGRLVFRGRNSADERVEYGFLRAKTVDVTDGTEDGAVEAGFISGGSEAVSFTWGDGVGVNTAPVSGYKFAVSGKSYFTRSTNVELLLEPDNNTTGPFTINANSDAFRLKNQSGTGYGTGGYFLEYDEGNDDLSLIGHFVVDANGIPTLRSYTVAGLPSAATAGQLIFVSDETGGAVTAFSDGTDWRRTTDRAVVS